MDNMLVMFVNQSRHGNTTHMVVRDMSSYLVPRPGLNSDHPDMTLSDWKPKRPASITMCEIDPSHMKEISFTCSLVIN